MINQKTYLRIAPAGINRAMHSLILQYIENISVYNKNGEFIPFMDLRYKRTGFHPLDDVSYNTNPWDNYFYQEELENIYNKKNIIIDTEPNDTSISILGSNDVALKAAYNNIIKEHLKIKESIISIIDNFIEKYFDNNTIGIHIRATDSFFDTGRPKIPLQYFIDLIQKKLTNYNKIFIATDTIHVIATLKKKFGNDRIISYGKMKRDIGSSSGYVHDQNDDPFNAGLEVIIDSILLSKCKILIRQTSAITTFSKLYNPDLIIHQFDIPFWIKDNYHCGLDADSKNIDKELSDRKKEVGNVFYIENLQLDNVNEYVDNYKKFVNCLEPVYSTVSWNNTYGYASSNKNIKLMKKYFFG